MTWSIQVHLDTVPEAVRAVRVITARLARDQGASDETAGSIELAVGEALINAQQHAYHGTPGPLDVDITVNDKLLAIAIHNHGRPLTDAPRIPKERPPLSSGHFGLYLIGRLMDQARIVHPVDERGGTAVRMMKRLA